MSNVPGGSRDQFTRGQCCLIRTSRFTTSVRTIDAVREPIDTTSGTLGKPTRSERGG